uniref:Uncharacterized protein n=1 Tax=Tanacetum cinerariifolium TaxID=118510 RepID=A0A699I2G8_TANCI|nr:hypothetical protein [Tanacetum cinerariifolium]
MQDLMNSLAKRYERLRKLPIELGIQSALPAPISQQAALQSSRRKRKHIETSPEIYVPGFDYYRIPPKGVLIVNNMVIEEPEYGLFFFDIYRNEAFQR